MFSHLWLVMCYLIYVLYFIRMFMRYVNCVNIKKRNRDIPLVLKVPLRLAEYNIFVQRHDLES